MRHWSRRSLVNLQQHAYAYTFVPRCYAQIERVYGKIEVFLRNICFALSRDNLEEINCIIY